MDEAYGTKRLLALRKLTRAASDLLRTSLKDHLGALAPLLRPAALFGEHVKSNMKETVKGADAALKEFQTLFESIAPVSPFGLSKELRAPLELASFSLDLAPAEYINETKSPTETKKVTVTAPLKWVLHYTGFPPRRLQELLAQRDRTDEVRQFVLHFLMLHHLMIKQPALGKLLRDLRYAVSTGPFDGCGALPITYVSAAVNTVRPPDEVIIESTEISGMAVFEEVLNPDDVTALRDPLREKLMDLAKQHGAVAPPPAPAPATPPS